MTDYQFLMIVLFFTALVCPMSIVYSSTFYMWFVIMLVYILKAARPGSGSWYLSSPHSWIDKVMTTGGILSGIYSLSKIVLASCHRFCKVQEISRQFPSNLLFGKIFMICSTSLMAVSVNKSSSFSLTHLFMLTVFHFESSFGDFCLGLSP